MVTRHREQPVLRYPDHLQDGVHARGRSDVLRRMTPIGDVASEANEVNPISGDISERLGKSLPEYEATFLCI